ncbi:MAG: sodium:solute symporter, partial [Acetobacteraceae bacterium]|nr:sodium:solute symporter [Acetobacteraceae bacterium]
NGWALLVGWAVGFVLGTWMFFANHSQPVYPLHLWGTIVPCYIAVSAVIVNIGVSVVLSLVLNVVASDRHNDLTIRQDYV